MAGDKYTYSSDWIYKLESEDHWLSYWYQQKLMENLVKPGDNVLEIGVGSGFTANYLRSKGVEVTTIDIDKSKNPDVVANLVEYEFPGNYDHVLAFEVFEHIPFDKFEIVLTRLNQCVNKYLFLSLPKNEKIWVYNKLSLHVFGNFTIKIATKRNRLNTDNHFWAFGYKQYTKKMIENTFKKHHFCIVSKLKFISLRYYCLEIK